MKSLIRNMIMVAVATTLALLPSVSQADTITNAAAGYFDVGATWVGGTAPVSGIDSVVIAYSVIIDSEFTIANGKSLTGVTGAMIRLGGGIII